MQADDKTSPELERRAQVKFKNIRKESRGPCDAVRVEEFDVERDESGLRTRVARGSS